MTANGISTNEIQALRAEALHAGDLEQVALCTLALLGDYEISDLGDAQRAYLLDEGYTLDDEGGRRAWAACAEVIAEAASEREWQDAFAD